MQLYFPLGNRHCKRRISSEAQKDLLWWATAIAGSPKRSIAAQIRDLVSTWSDAASTKGLGAYYTTPSQPYPQIESILSIALPTSPIHQREHINTKEMRAVEQLLLYFGRGWKGKRVVIHTDNRVVSYGLANGTIRGASMEVLRRCLLLAAEYDLDLQPEWISTTNNSLADALSRLDYIRVTNLAPQLAIPECRLPNLGL